ncbi:helix-turn-helix domain-containing protein [Salinibaculum salinum]|uniref:helix-turn-helix domain-containing protein n=1 Tax=Salinibaculum salinum TaxID=3131996 RepID=UPI0030EB2DF2
MIVEFQFESPLLRTALRDGAVGKVTIEQLDATDAVPFRTVCLLDSDDTAPFEASLEADRTVERATQVVDTDYGTQYDVTYAERYPGTEIYDAAVETGGIFISGTRRPDHWEMAMRFPDRDSFGSFRHRMQSADLSVQSLYQQETISRAERYDISEAQREILLLASERDYFDVPREASLAELADELDVSSQAASERLRRGLDSLVERALLTPE